MEPCLDDIFYDTSSLCLDEKVNLLNDAYAINYDAEIGHSKISLTLRDMSLKLTLTLYFYK